MSNISIWHILFLLSRICLIIRLPPFLQSSHRIVASLRCRCKGVYEVLTDVQGRASRFCEKSSLRPFGCEVFILKNLVRPNLYTEKPLKRNDRRDRKTHQIKKRRSKMKATLKIAFWLVLAMFVSSMFGGSIWAWSIGLWLCKEIIAGVIRFLFGCIVFLLSAVALFGFLFWLLTL